MSTSEPDAGEIRKETDASKTAIPVQGDGFQHNASEPTPDSAIGSQVEEEYVTEDGKVGKRGLFGFGKKKVEKGKGKNKSGLELSGSSMAAALGQRNIASPQASTTVSGHPNSPYIAQSPIRNLHSSSPRISPAGSQIFERDVQESTLPMPNSPAIPSHIQTEDHIPSVLDASSEAITNKELNPDAVEIIMHSSHQPAAVTVTGISSNESTTGAWVDDLVAHPDKDDAASNYGALDSTDVRRLSFISFADVVHSEHAEHLGSRETTYVAGLTSLSSGHRSPSPMRSPVSSQGFGTSPPTSKSASVKGLELSPTRSNKTLGSPTTSHPPLFGGELTIESMTQALRKTGSGELSGARSPLNTDGFPDRLLR